MCFNTHFPRIETYANLYLIMWFRWLSLRLVFIMCALFWLNVISCHQSKRRKRSIKVIMGRELVSAFGILFIFPLGNNLYALLWWHIISLFQRAVIKHSKYFLDRTVGLYFCILFESLWAEPTLPPFLPPFLLPASLSPSSGEGLHRRPWWVTSAVAKQRRVTRGNGALYF